MRMSTLRLILAAALVLAPFVVQPSQLHIAATPDGVDSGRPITVRAQPVPFGGNGGDRTGRLRYLAGLHLTSDNEDFGGFSGLTIDDGGHLTAVSDQGHWLTAELRLDPRGTVTGLRAARIGRLCDDDGAPVAWERRDAEEIQRLPGRGFLVSFERHHRIVLYAASGNGEEVSGGAVSDGAVLGGVPRPFPFPPAIIDTWRNRGMEAIAPLPDGRLLTFAEDLRTINGDIIGWIGRPDSGDWRHLTLAAREEFLPTGAALLPTGDVVLLERSYSRSIGSRVRLLLLEAANLVPGARLLPVELALIEPPATVDNMEAVAVHSGPGGEILIFLLSDNNYNDRQRTLLMQFELLDSRGE